MGLDDLLGLDGSYFALRKDHAGPQFYLQRRRQLMLTKFSSADPNVSLEKNFRKKPLSTLILNNGTPPIVHEIGFDIFAKINCAVFENEEEAVGAGIWEIAAKVRIAFFFLLSSSSLLCRVCSLNYYAKINSSYLGGIIASHGFGIFAHEIFPSFLFLLFLLSAVASILASQAQSLSSPSSVSLLLIIPFQRIPLMILQRTSLSILKSTQ